MSAPAVEVADLCRTFGDFVAVDHVTFAVQPGEVFGLLGPNGAGKTTTIKMLAGLVLPSSGTGSVAGHALGDTAAIKRHIGYMSQLFSLYADLTVEENLEFFSGLYGVARDRRAERTAWALATAGLADHRRQLTAELSLGWKQRLALVSAVLHEPPVLFLDEPTSGVDPISRRSFWDLIYELAAGGTTVLVTTHYMEEAEYCHRLALMNRGRLIALDKPAGLRAASKAPLFEIQVGVGGDGPAAVEALLGAPGVLQAGLFGRALHVTVSDGAGARAALSERLAGRGIAVASIAEIEPSLEDVFVELVEEAGGAPVEGS